MPHIDIKHFPTNLDEEKIKKCVGLITAAVKKTFNCKEDVISITIEPVEPNDWNDRVYQPEIVKREKWLQKRPGYGTLMQNK